MIVKFELFSQGLLLFPLRVDELLGVLYHVSLVESVYAHDRANDDYAGENEPLETEETFDVVNRLAKHRFDGDGNHVEQILLSVEDAEEFRGQHNFVIQHGEHRWIRYRRKEI